MTGPVGPVGPAKGAAAPKRRKSTSPKGAAKSSKPAGTATTPAVAPKPAKPLPDPAFAAQLMGQVGQKKGLKGGKVVLDQARSTYLGTEYSGKADRRPPKGRLGKTEV
jgi:hypothetical protein